MEWSNTRVLYTTWNPPPKKKNNNNNGYLSVSTVMFCKQCLAYTVHIDWCNNATYP